MPWSTWREDIVNARKFFTMKAPITLENKIERLLFREKALAKLGTFACLNAAERHSI